MPEELPESTPQDTVLLGSKPMEWLAPMAETAQFIRAEVVGGPMDGLRQMVSTDALAMGRGTENDMVLPLDPMVSGSHAVIIREDGEFWLEDNGSRNGTFVDRKRISQRTRLKPGALFYVGGTCLEFMPR